MNIAEAKQKVMDIAGGKFHSLQYIVNDLGDGCVNQICKVYIEGFQLSKARYWETAIDKLAEEINGRSNAIISEDMPVSRESDNTPLRHFIEECCVEKFDSEVTVSDLYSAFSAWFKSNIDSRGKYIPSQKIFTTRIKQITGCEVSNKNGVSRYTGLMLHSKYADLVSEYSNN